MKRLLLVTVLLCGPSLAVAQTTRVTPLLTKELTGIPGKEGSILTVEYPPGASSPIHRHNAHVFVYVLEGTVIMQVRGGAEVRLTQGQTFYESPSDIHVVSRNASTSEPAKFIVFSVKDIGAPILVPAN
jgi:quercetin dioxygenase-like cupin family protein